MMTIFQDPLEWSRRAVGSVFAYGVMLGSHVAFAVGLAVFWQLGWWDNIAVLGLALAFGVFFPMLYLYALRHVVLREHMKSEKTEE